MMKPILMGVVLGMLWQVNVTQPNPSTQGVITTQFVQQTGSRVMLNSDFTNATTTLNNTALSVTLTTGRKYSFIISLIAADSTAADGMAADLNGGTAGVTNLRVLCSTLDSAALQGTLMSTTLAGALTNVGSMSATGGIVICYGTMEPSSTGTFIVRAAQKAHTTGTLTIYRGSYLWVEDMP